MDKSGLSVLHMRAQVVTAMAQATIKFPNRMDLGAALAFGLELERYAMHERVTLDFSDQGFRPPFVMLFIAAKIKRFRAAYPKVELVFRGYETQTYAAHVGFFHMLGIPHGREVGEAHGSDRYLPITCIERKDFYEKETDRFEELPDLIQRHAERLAHVVAQDNRVMNETLSFSIRELMRNVFEHSESNILYYCAQYWEKSGKVEFSLADFGIGIRKALGTNPNFRFDTDKQAIEWSLLPSVSGKTHLPRQSTTWFNSGYGLYMTSRLARNGGNFAIASGNMGIFLSRKTKTNLPTAFPGTILRVNFDVNEIGNVTQRLDEFRREGAEQARKISGSGNRPPSAMSLLLRRDYAK